MMTVPWGSGSGIQVDPRTRSSVNEEYDAGDGTGRMILQNQLRISRNISYSCVYRRIGWLYHAVR